MNRKNTTEKEKYYTCDNCKFHNPMTDYCTKLKKTIMSGCHVCSKHELTPEKKKNEYYRR